MKCEQLYKMRNLLILLVFNVGIILCDPLFIRGRPHNKYGMLGLPTDNDVDVFSTAQAIKDQWMDQRLNHYDPTDKRRWKQVYSYS